MVRSRIEADPGLVGLRNPNADKGGPDWDELTLLHTAAKSVHLDMVKWLVEAGAEVYSNPMSSYPAVALAAWDKHQDVVDYFLKEIPGRAAGTNGLGVMCNLAGRFGWLDIVRRHVERDPLVVHQRGWIGDTPLHWPAHNDSSDIVGVLLAAGADPNAHVTNWMGGTPLHWASERSPRSLKLLIDAGADVNARVLLDEGMKDATPLVWCAKQRDDCAECAEVLLAAGADRSLTDAEGKSALDHAVAQGHNRVAAALR